MDEFNLLPFSYESFNGTDYKNENKPDITLAPNSYGVNIPENENEWEMEYQLIYHSYILETGV